MNRGAGEKAEQGSILCTVFPCSARCISPPACIRELCLYGAGVRLICILDDMTVGAKRGPNNVPCSCTWEAWEAHHLVEDMKVRR